MSYAGKPYQPPGSVPIAPPQEATNPLGVVSLVLGIMSVFMGCPLAIGALITGWIGMKKEPSGLARAGFIMGLVMTLVNAAFAALGILFFVVFGGLIGLGAYLDSQERTSQTYPTYDSASFPATEMPSPHMGGEPYAIPEMPMPAMPASMPGGMEPSALPPGMPAPYMPPPYVPPPMPGVPSSPFPGPPGYAPPTGLGPPGAFPPGAFPPGLGPPVTVEPESSDETS